MSKLIFVFLFLYNCFSWVGAQINQTDAQGRKQGLWQKNYPGTAVLQYKGSFLNDQPVGTFIYHFETGQKKAELVHGQPGGCTAVLLFYENGQLLADGFYKGEKKDSLWYNYTLSGELVSAENYKLGELNGKSVYYYPEGQIMEHKLQIRKVVHYSNGKLDGAFQENFYNGKLKLKGTYQNGVRIGLWTEYFNTGEVQTRVHYMNDLPHGWTLVYDKMGNVKKRIMYRDGYALTQKETREFLERCKARNLDPNQ
jgi:antitoxin component YwqK of YwqJK toxin-antitoxin module